MWYCIKAYIIFPVKEAIMDCGSSSSQYYEPYKVGTKVPYTHVPGFKYGAQDAGA